VVYLAQVDAKTVQPQADDDAAEVAWHSLRQPPPLAFDHEQVLECARRRLKEGG
jgi:8-oxo-dGTP diphosphatase